VRGDPIGGLAALGEEGGLGKATGGQRVRGIG